MRNGQVTPDTAKRVVPVVYIDVDIHVDLLADEKPSDVDPAEVCMTGVYPGVRAVLLAERGPGGGNPLYRIEGPLPQIIQWVFHRYDSGDVQSNLAIIASAMLAQ